MEFLSQAFSFPTAIWSGLLILVVGYWLTVLLGGLDLELFDGLFEAAEGAAEGVAEGVAEGAAEGAGARRGCLSALGVGEVPLAISLSLVVVFGWVLSYGGTALLGRVTQTAAWGLLAALGLGLGSLVVAFGLTAVVLLPLRKALRTPPSLSHHDLVGRPCRLTTGSVDREFGQAEVEVEDGSVVLVQVRSFERNELTRGSRALIFDYDPAQGSFQVTPLEGELADWSPEAEDLE